MIKWKNDLVRFSIEYGPQSLFERIMFKMKDVHKLNLDNSHYNERKASRHIPKEVIDRIENFDINEWQLKTAEVRKDRGKFYHSTWEYIFKGESYWITIGLNETVITIVRKSSSGLSKCVKSGELYNFVESVNEELNNAEKQL